MKRGTRVITARHVSATAQDDLRRLPRPVSVESDSRRYFQKHFRMTRRNRREEQYDTRRGAVVESFNAPGVILQIAVVNQ